MKLADINPRLAGVFVAAFVAAMAIVSLPTEIAGIVVFVFLAFLATVLFPKQTMLLLALFLPFQKLLAQRTEDNLFFLSLLFKRAEEGIILVAFFTIIVDRWLLKKANKTGVGWLIALLVLIAVASTVKNRIVGYDIAVFDLFLLLKGFFVFYIFYALDFSVKDLKLVVRACLFLGLLIFALGLVDLLFPVRFRALVGNDTTVAYRFGIPSVKSIFIHPGAFGWFMAFFAVFSASFFVVLEKKKYLGLTVLFILGTILSMRFKPLLGLLAVAGAAFVVISKEKKVRYVFIALLLLFCFTFLFGEKAKLLFEDKLYTYFEAPELQDVARNVLYSTGWRIALDYFPFGSGLATFGGWIAALYYSPLYIQYGISEVWGLDPLEGGRFLTDTFWPYIIGQFGFFGFLCYAGIFLSFFVTSIKGYVKANDLFIKAFILGTVLVLVEGLIESVAEPVFVTPPHYYYIFACLGITYSYAKRTIRMERTA